MGVVPDPAANVGGAGHTSAASGAVEVHVVPIGEEAMIARHTLACVAR